jgi:hypothetical protein
MGQWLGERMSSWTHGEANSRPYQLTSLSHSCLNVPLGSLYCQQMGANMTDSTTTAARIEERPEARSMPPPLEPVQPFRSTPPRTPQYLGDAVRQPPTATEQRASVGPMPSTPAIAYSILEMIRFANDYLRNSPDECHRERSHECQRLEMILISTGNFSGYRFLESRITDMTRREYTITPRLLYSPPQTY